MAMMSRRTCGRLHGRIDATAIQQDVLPDDVARMIAYQNAEKMLATK